MTPSSPGVVVFDHPLIQHKLSYLRDASVGHRPFRALLYQIAGLMVYEATRTLPTTDVLVRTPVEETKCTRLATSITVVPVLRSGLGMAEGIMEMMPEARVGHLGLARDEQTKLPTVYLQRLPKDIHAGPVLLVDPCWRRAGAQAWRRSCSRMPEQPTFEWCAWWRHPRAWCECGEITPMSPSTPRRWIAA